MITIFKKNKDGLATEVKCIGDLPTDTDYFSYGCLLYKIDEEVVLYENYSQPEEEPLWRYRGVSSFSETANGYITEQLLADDAVTKDKLNYSVHVVTIAPMATSGESIADPLIAGGQILGFYPIGNQDKFVTNVEITEDFKAKITLGSAATAPNIFNVVILKT